MIMFLNKLFFDADVDFGKRCRRRILVGGVDVLLGVAAVAVALFLRSGGGTEVDFRVNVYLWTGVGIGVGGVGLALRNWRLLRNEEMFRKREIEETDERNRLLGLRAWAYAGYTMFLLLYVGILVCGVVNETAAVVLMAVVALNAALLFFFRVWLSKCM